MNKMMSNAHPPQVCPSIWMLSSGRYAIGRAIQNQSRETM